MLLQRTVFALDPRKSDTLAISHFGWDLAGWLGLNQFAQTIRLNVHFSNESRAARWYFEALSQYFLHTWKHLVREKRMCRHYANYLISLLLLRSSTQRIAYKQVKVEVYNRPTLLWKSVGLDQSSGDENTCTTFPDSTLKVGTEAALVEACVNCTGTLLSWRIECSWKRNKRNRFGEDCAYAFPRPGNDRYNVSF